MAEIQTKARLADATRGVGKARRALKSTASAAGAAEIDVDKPLTDKQKAFVDSWARGNSIGRASLDAGFADDGIGYRLVRQPNVLKLKAQYEAKYEAEAQMTRKRVMDGFLESIEMARLMSEPATMISGWTAIAKLCGYMAPIEHKVKVDVSGNVTMQRLSAMTDEELLELVERGRPNASTQLLEDQTGVGEAD